MIEQLVGIACLSSEDRGKVIAETEEEEEIVYAHIGKPADASVLVNAE